MNYTSYLICDDPSALDLVKKYIPDEPVNFFNGKGYPSFSKLVNDCVFKSPTETVILMSFRVSPKPEHLKKTIDLLEEGYGFVGLYRFGFFGLKKELFRKVGVMDEEFIGGGFEDDDFYVRMLESDIAMYLSHEVEYRTSVSTWNLNHGKKRILEKWNSWPKRSGIAKRMIPEKNFGYDFGESVPTNFLPWSKTNIYTPDSPIWENYYSIQVQT